MHNSSERRLDGATWPRGTDLAHNKRALSEGTTAGAWRAGSGYREQIGRRDSQCK